MAVPGGVSLSGHRDAAGSVPGARHGENSLPGSGVVPFRCRRFSAKKPPASPRPRENNTVETELVGADMGGVKPRSQFSSRFYWTVHAYKVGLRSRGQHLQPLKHDISKSASKIALVWKQKMQDVVAFVVTRCFFRDVSALIWIKL